MNGGSVWNGIVTATAAREPLGWLAGKFLHSRRVVPRRRAMPAGGAVLAPIETIVEGDLAGRGPMGLAGRNHPRWILWRQIVGDFSRPGCTGSCCPEAGIVK